LNFAASFSQFFCLTGFAFGALRNLVGVKREQSPRTSRVLSMVEHNRIAVNDFVRLFLAHQRRILTYLAAIVGNLGDAEDLLQETGVVLWERLETYEPDSDFCAWALAIAHNKALEHLRKTGRRNAILRGEVAQLLAQQASHMSPQLEAEHRALSLCIDHLPGRLRQVITLRYQERTQVQSVAEQIGRSTVTVRKMLHKAYALLLKCITQRMEAEEAL
jgi:RNA polymerase sigma-70 factor (ECF subfamily)